MQYAPGVLVLVPGDVSPVLALTSLEVELDVEGATGVEALPDIGGVDGVHELFGELSPFRLLFRLKGVGWRMCSLSLPCLLPLMLSTPLVILWRQTSKMETNMTTVIPPTVPPIIPGRLL
jgi:hypothetical protein